MSAVAGLTDNLMKTVPRSAVTPTETLAFDVFLKLATDRYVKVASAGQPNLVHSFKFYNDNTIFFIRETDFKALLKNVFTLITPKPHTETQVDISNVYKVTELLWADIKQIGITQENLEYIQIIGQNLELLEQTNQSLEIILRHIRDQDSAFVKHSILVTFVSVLIANSSSHLMPSVYRNLIAGAFLHDIGFLKLPRDLSTRPVEAMNADEKEIYLSHPTLGEKFLKSFNSVPADVIRIVGEHHENSAGEGYPFSLKADEQHDLSKIVALAEGFVELMTGHTSNSAPMLPKQAIHSINNIMGQPFDPELFEALKKIILAG